MSTESGKSILLLHNPRAGGRTGREFLRSLLSAAEDKAFPVDVRALGEQDFETDLYSHVVLAGGDGTISAILTRSVDSAVLFHILPFGTGNDLARQLGLKIPAYRDIPTYFERLPNSQRKAMPVWEAEWQDIGAPTERRRFVNYLSFGWDAHVVWRFHQSRMRGNWLSGRMGPWGNRLLYTLNGFPTLGTVLPKLFVKTASEERAIPAGYRSIVVSSVSSIMGLGWMSNLSELSDNLLELYPIASVFQYAEMLLPFSFRPFGLESSALQAESYSFEIPEPEPIFLQIDGEPLEPLKLSRLDIRRVGMVQLGVPT